MRSWTPTQHILVFFCRMRPDSLQIWQGILFDLNLCREDLLPYRNACSLDDLCWKPSILSGETIDECYLFCFGLDSFFNTVTTGQRNTSKCYLDTPNLPIDFCFSACFRCECIIYIPSPKPNLPEILSPLVTMLPNMDGVPWDPWQLLWLLRWKTSAWMGGSGEGWWLVRA